MKALPRGKAGERKRAEHFTGTGNGHFIFVAQLIHTEDGDDILQFLVTLKDELNTVCAIVVLVAHDSRC